LLAVIKEAFWGSLNSIKTIALILVPMMIFLQIARDYRLLDKVSNSLWGFARILGISKDAIFPLLVGIFFGISYGAGVIIETSKQGNLTKKDLLLIVIFLITCHGIVEDTLIFVVIGANGWLLVLLRTIVAILLTMVLSKRLSISESKRTEGME
jgi:hypothetical protein